MIRLIIVKLGNGHDDFFLKIDLIPSCSRTADSCYLSDFLEIDDSEIEGLKRSDDSILSLSAVNQSRGQGFFTPF